MSVFRTHISCIAMWLVQVSAHFSLGVNCASLMLSRFDIKLVSSAMPTVFSGLVCFLWQPWLLLKPRKWSKFTTTKWLARLILSIWFHWMRCVMFSEQHLQKDFGGCDANRVWHVAIHSRLSYQDLGQEKMALLCCRVLLTRWEW